MLIYLKDRAKLWRRRVGSIGGRLEAKLRTRHRGIGTGKPRINASTGNSHMANACRSNLDVWKRLQSEDYFERHPCYKGISEFGGDEAVQAINWFLPLRPDMKIAVIGCGYGRESLKL